MMGVMLLAGAALFGVGLALCLRFRREAAYEGIGHPFPVPSVLYVLGVILVIAGGFLAVFAGLILAADTIR